MIIASAESVGQEGLFVKKLAVIGAVAIAFIIQPRATQEADGQNPV